MTGTPVPTIERADNDGHDFRAGLQREWLVTNGLGGYASAILSGACLRRYHGLLIAALPAPFGRTVMFNHLGEELRFRDHSGFRLDIEDLTNTAELEETALTRTFRLDNGLPVWTYEGESLLLEKRVWLPYLQNTVFVMYRLIEAPDAIRLRLRPSVHFRMHELPVGGLDPADYSVAARGQRFEVIGEDFPPLRMHVVAPRSSLVLDGGQVRQIHYETEESRGYEHVGDLWSPGYFRADIEPGQCATLVASTEDWETILAAEPAAALEAEYERRRRLLARAKPAARDGWGADLVLAADQFVVQPMTRMADAAMAHAAGDEVRTIIAGYHWFTDWGRDTMISMEGLLLETGRPQEAGYLLRTFARFLRDGLIPNLFPEGEQEGLYHTADASLWFFHALERYYRATGDRVTLEVLLPKVKEIVDHHVRGTRFGIQVDPEDGLLRQGAEGYQLTWMDAKVGDWVVTPRRGKAVEINALWYNALRLLEHWCHELGGECDARDLAERAEQTRQSFNRRFWYEEGGYLYDVVDGECGDDLALRPNQVFAISLDHPVLQSSRWKPVMDVVTRHLLTPVGLRSLAPGHPDYKCTYYGDLRARDAAYHQGTVWAWLMGPYIDAWLRIHPYEREQARQFLAGFEAHLRDAGMGTISEVFDAEAPFTPRGCIAQAWSVAEVLRCLVRTAPDKPGNS